MRLGRDNGGVDAVLYTSSTPLFFATGFFSLHRLSSQRSLSPRTFLNEDGISTRTTSFIQDGQSKDHGIVFRGSDNGSLGTYADVFPLPLQVEL